MWIKHPGAVELKSRRYVLQAVEQLVRCGLARWSSNDANRRALILSSGKVLVFEVCVIHRLC